jgi:YtkA-like
MAVGILDGPRGISMSRLGVPALLVALSGFAACGGGGIPAAGADPMLPPTWAALTSLPSAGGALQVAVWTSPQPAIKGVDDVVYRITDAGGMPVDGLAIQVVPWMPAHGHGTSAMAVVEAKGDGYYLAKPVYLYMSGRWELRTTVDGNAGDDAGASAGDSVVPVIDIP